MFAACPLTNVSSLPSVRVLPGDRPVMLAARLVSMPRMLATVIGLVLDDLYRPSYGIIWIPTPLCRQIPYPHSCAWGQAGMLSCVTELATLLLQHAPAYGKGTSRMRPHVLCQKLENLQ